MKPEVYKAKKLWGGRVSIRSSVLKYAKRTHRKVKIIYDGQYMYVDANTPYETTAPPQIAQRTDKYMRKGEAYELFDYVWSPVVEKNVVDYTSEGLSKLAEAWANFKKGRQMGIDK